MTEATKLAERPPTTPAPVGTPTATIVCPPLSYWRTPDGKIWVADSYGDLWRPGVDAPALAKAPGWVQARFGPLEVLPANMRRLDGSPLHPTLSVPVKACCGALASDQCDCAEQTATAHALFLPGKAIMCRPASEWGA